ncbi:hypothetical protein B0H13DRAFT_2353250 [Mycena leptocephala]|nr:hypothetical protein B0H13DRAFT_2353250 [Mycena leptocephala]
MAQLEDDSPPAKKRKTGIPAQHALLLVRARREGWPTEINFDLAPRIHSLLPELNLLETDAVVLEKSPVWLKFLERIDYQVFAFSKSAEQFPDAQLGCGYFGPKGHAIIVAEVKNCHHTVPESAFFRPIVKLVDLPRRWDSIGKEFITAEHFATYVLVPHIAASLISVDLDISLQSAVNVLIDSREYGCVNHPEQGEASIPTPPNDTTSQPPRHRKKNVNLKPRTMSGVTSPVFLHYLVAPAATPPQFSGGCYLKPLSASNIMPSSAFYPNLSHSQPSTPKYAIFANKDAPGLRLHFQVIQNILELLEGI